MFRLGERGDGAEGARWQTPDKLPPDAFIPSDS
jgi:hypothetical protein